MVLNDYDRIVEEEGRLSDLFSGYIDPEPEEEPEPDCGLRDDHSGRRPRRR